MTDIVLDSPFGKLLLIALLLLLILFAVSIPLDGGSIINNPAHSVARHGADATAIHTTLDCNGPSEVWQSRSWKQQNKFFQVCELPDGRWGCRIVRTGKEASREVTSFVPGEGTRMNIIEYLSARATCVWS